MATQYVYNINPFQDLLMKYMEYGINMFTKKNASEITESFKYILENILDNPKDVVYLDFEISRRKDVFTLIGKNFITSLWLSNIYISDAKLIVGKNKLTFEDRTYYYDDKTNKLTFTIKK